MDAYELISPKTGKPCGVWVCGKCNLVTPADIVEKCCAPCGCGKPSRNGFEAKCSDCANTEHHARRMEQLAKAELVEWDGSMILSEEVQGCRDGWFDSPEDLQEYCEDHDYCVPEFAFVGRKQVNTLDLSRALEAITDDTYEDAELHVSNEDMAELEAAVDKFNAKYSLTYYEPDYKRKVRVSKKREAAQ